MPPPHGKAIPHKILRSFDLKLIALCTMMIDHVGAVFVFPGSQYFRIIGRISFPIFAFLITEGFAHSSNAQKYLMRLGIFALLSEVPFDLAFSGTIWNPQSQNVFFTLCLGLSAIYLFHIFKQKEQAAFGILLLLVIMAVAEFIGSDYGYLGVALIFSFYIFREAPILSFLLFGLIETAMAFKYNNRNQIFAFLAVLPILLYSGEKGPSGGKYLFYAAYPVHLFILFYLFFFFFS